MNSKIAPQFGSRNPPLTVIDGYGTSIVTKEYGKMFDAVAGYWYNVLGMRHPELLEVKQKIGGITTHLYDEYTNPFAEDLSEILCKKTNTENVIFSATGSMANENARKEAIKYHQSKGIKEDEIVFSTIKGSYHGSVGEMLKWIDSEKNDLTIDEPIYDNILKIKSIINDFKEKIEIANKNGKVIGGFFFEPVMGVRGIVPLPDEYINNIAEICKKNDILLIADEVTTGIGRTGEFYYSRKFNFQPDIICMGKAISGGHYPIATTLVTKKITDAWEKIEKSGVPYYKIHRRGNSITGTQEGCALGLKVLEIIERDNLIEQVRSRGKYALEKLEEIIHFKSVREIRGKGLLIGIDVENSDFAKKKIMPKMREKGINIFPEGRVITFNPAYLVTEKEIDMFVKNLLEVLE